MNNELRDRIDSLNRKWAKENKIESKDIEKRIRLASDLEEVKIISTGNPALDWALGGGIPEGTIFEISGNAGVGKSFTMSYIMAEVQKLDKIVIYYHTEESRKPSEMWRVAGVDENNVIYIDARGFGEDGINQINDLLTTKTGLIEKEIGLVVIDSVAALSPKAEMNSVDENGLEGATMGRHAAMMSKMFRVICGRGLQNEGCLFGLVNQERKQIGSVPLPNLTTGGLAIQYAPKIRVQLKAPKDGYIFDDEKSNIGHTVEFTVIKNNTGIGFPFKKGTWKVLYGKGIDYITPVIEEAISYGLIEQISKSYIINYSIKENWETQKVVGKGSLIKTIEDNTLILNSLRENTQKLRDYIQLNNIEHVINTGYFLGKDKIDLLNVLKTTKDEITIEKE